MSDEETRLQVQRRIIDVALHNAVVERDRLRAALDAGYRHIEAVIYSCTDDPCPNPPCPQCDLVSAIYRSMRAHELLDDDELPNDAKNLRSAVGERDLFRSACVALLGILIETGGTPDGLRWILSDRGESVEVMNAVRALFEAEPAEESESDG